MTRIRFKGFLSARMPGTPRNGLNLCRHWGLSMRPRRECNLVSNRRSVVIKRGEMLSHIYRAPFNGGELHLHGSFPGWKIGNEEVSDMLFVARCGRRVDVDEGRLGGDAIVDQ